MQEQIEALESAVASFREHDEKAKLSKECANAAADEIGDLMRKHDLESYVAQGGYQVSRESFTKVKVRKPRGA